VAVALVLGLAAMAAGCGTTAPKLSPRRVAEQRQERIDLALASRELERLGPSLEAQARAARQTWPLVADGLDGPLAAHARAMVARAAARAEAIVLPASFKPESYVLTGPASDLAGLLQHFDALAVRGWQLILQAVHGGGSPAARSFTRENAGLYVGSVYKGNFDLGLLGKSLLRSYERLGGPSAFGRTLTEARVRRLAAIYSPAVFDLPHPRESPGG
jgi:hypothetical protein